MTNWLEVNPGRGVELISSRIVIPSWPVNPAYVPNGYSTLLWSGTVKNTPAEFRILGFENYRNYAFYIVLETLGAQYYLHRPPTSDLAADHMPAYPDYAGQTLLDAKDFYILDTVAVQNPANDLDIIIKISEKALPTNFRDSAYTTYDEFDPVFGSPAPV